MIGTRLCHPAPLRNPPRDLPRDPPPCAAGCTHREDDNWDGWSGLELSREHPSRVPGVLAGGTSPCQPLFNLPVLQPYA